MRQPEVIYAYIGKRIRQERRALGFNQAELAQEIGYVRPSIANIETGRQRMLVHTLYEIAEALAVPVQALLPPDADAAYSAIVGASE